MSRDCVECPEVTGKTIKLLKIYETPQTAVNAY